MRQPLGELRLVICNIQGSYFGCEYVLTEKGNQELLAEMILDKVMMEGLLGRAPCVTRGRQGPSKKVLWSDHFWEEFHRS